MKPQVMLAGQSRFGRCEWLGGEMDGRPMVWFDVENALHAGHGTPPIAFPVEDALRFAKALLAQAEAVVAESEKAAADSGGGA